MDLIYQNPFRILALPITASEREIVKRIGDLSIYAEMGSDIEYDCDNYLIDKPIRTPETINEAKQKIDRPNNRLFYSLFWFWEDTENVIDTMAFDALRTGKVEQAISFWEQGTENLISSTNRSNYKNLFTMQLAISSQNGEFKKSYFLNSILNSGKFLANGHFEEYANHVLGGRHSFSLAETTNLFIDEIVTIVKPYLDKEKNENPITISELLSHFSPYNDSVQNDILERFTVNYTHNIEQQIERCNQVLNDNVAQSYDAGYELYKITQDDLSKLKSALSSNSLKYQLLVDKLADVIVSCSIAYFNEYRDTDHDPGDEALRLLKIARGIAVGDKIKERIDEGLPIVQEYVVDKPQRDKLLPVKKERDFIYSLLNAANAGIPSSQLPEKAGALVEGAKPKLNSMSDVLGSLDPDYLSLSDLVSSNAIGMCVEYLNWVVDDANQRYSNNEFARRVAMQTAITTIKPPFLKIGVLDMAPTTRSNFRDIREKLGMMTQSRTTSSSTSSGCYIATMVYGEYDAPQVLVLRKYRDEVLLSSIIGRIVVKYYYHISPWFVEKTKNMGALKFILRNILNRLVKYLGDHNEN